MKSYYRLQDGRVDGPYAEQELQRMWQAGDLGVTDRLRLEGSRDWLPLKTVLETLPDPRAGQTPRWKRELRGLAWVLVLGILAGVFVVVMRYREEAPLWGGPANSKGAARVQVQSWIDRHAPEIQIIDLSEEFVCDGNRCRLVVARTKSPEGKLLSSSMICAFGGGGVLWAVDSVSYLNELRANNKEGAAEMIQRQQQFSAVMGSL